MGRGVPLVQIYILRAGKISTDRARKGRKKMQKIQNLQDGFLNQVRRERLLVTVFLMNGFQMKGYVRGFDSFVVTLDSEGKQMMIYKHAISTVIPARAVSLTEADAD